MICDTGSPYMAFTNEPGVAVRRLYTSAYSKDSGEDVHHDTWYTYLNARSDKNQEV